MSTLARVRGTCVNSEGPATELGPTGTLVMIEPGTLEGLALLHLQGCSQSRFLSTQYHRTNYKPHTYILQGGVPHVHT